MVMPKTTSFLATRMMFSAPPPGWAVASTPGTYFLMTLAWPAATKYQEPLEEPAMIDTYLVAWATCTPAKATVKIRQAISMIPKILFPMINSSLKFDS